jgi:hypothetical protein
VLGIDFVKNNLSIAEDRLLQHRNTSHPNYPARYPVKVDFICGDSTKSIKTGEAGVDALSKSRLFNTISRLFPKPYPFHLISCQFSLHYFTGSQQDLEIVLQNVSDNLMIGGYFFGTTLDGALIFQKLKNLNKIEGILETSDKMKKTIWSLEKQYTDETFKEVGQIEKTAKKFGLEKVDSFKSFSTIFEEISGTHPNIKKMSKAEMDYSFLNKYFIFQKTSESAISQQGGSRQEKQTQTPIKKIIRVRPSTLV